LRPEVEALVSGYYCIAVFPFRLVSAAMKISLSSGIIPLIENTEIIRALSDERPLVFYLLKDNSYLTNTLVLFEKLKLQGSSLSGIIRSKAIIHVLTLDGSTHF
jgi:hypothetical protein